MERQVREETAKNVKRLFQKGTGFEVGQTKLLFIITPYYRRLAQGGPCHRDLPLEDH